MAPSQHRKLCSECERLESDTNPNITADYQNPNITVCFNGMAIFEACLAQARKALEQVSCKTSSRLKFDRKTKGMVSR